MQIYQGGEFANVFNDAKQVSSNMSHLPMIRMLVVSGLT